MSITAFGLLLGFAAGAPIPPVVPATARETRAEFEHLAGQFKVFDLGSFMSASHWTQDISSLPPGYRADYQRLTLQLTHPRHQTASLIELLRHANPHVRTLALGALAAKGDPKVLPQIAALVHDHAPTLPFPWLPSSGWESRIKE